MSGHEQVREDVRARPPGDEPDAPPGEPPGHTPGNARWRVPQITVRWRPPIATYVVCQVIFLFWWVAFYPGLASLDSVIYVRHVTTGPWVADHSVAYDALVWLSLHATGDLGALTLAQTVAMSAAFAYTVAAFHRLGVPQWWTAAAAVAVAALPSTGTFIVFIWKDVPFAICTYLVVPTVAHLASLRGQPGWREDRRVNWLVAALGMELLGICVFRLNGFLVVVLAGFALLLLLPGVRARLAAAAAVALCLAFVLNLYVYPAVGIKKAPPYLALATANADIAVAYAQRPSIFTAADRRLMARVVPLTQWKQSANCYTADSTVYLPGFDVRAGRVSGQLFSLWTRILRRSPGVILGARICRASIAWAVFPGSPFARAYPYPSRIPADLWGHAGDLRDNPYRGDLATRPPWAGMNKAATFLRRVAMTRALQWLLWRGATWSYVAYLAVFALSRRRRNWALLSMAAIVAGQQVALVIDNPAQPFRYMAGPLIIGMILVPLFFARDPGSPARSERAAG